MNPQNNNTPDTTRDANQSTDNGEKSSQISLPQNDESRGPFEHSGQTARQTEEQQAEEEKEKD